MQDIRLFPACPKIATATSDCGRVVYSPIGNDRLLIDGRDVYQGHWCGPDGMMTDRVPTETMAPAIELMREVDAINFKIDEEMRDRDIQRQNARDQRWADAMANVPAHLTLDDL